MDWSTENLGDLYKIGSSKRVLKSQWQTSGVPFYRGREITVLSKHGEVSNELFISEELYQEYAKKHGVPATEDIVITAIGTIGNSYIVGANDRFYFKDASVLWLKKTSNVDSSFINLWLKSPLMREQLDEGNGATVDTLTIKKLQTLQVNLPPIPEQQRIVAILDQASADIEKARANAEKNLKNARELFDSYLNQVFSQRGEGWVEKSLDEIVEEGCSLSYGIVQPGDDFPNGLPVVRPTDLKSKIIHVEGLKLINPELATGYRRTTLEGGELLLCVRGSTGVISIASQELSGANVTRGIVPIRFNKFIIMQTFGYYQFISEIIQKQVRAHTYGAALMQINIRDLRKLTFVIPPVSFQSAAIPELDDMARNLARLETVYLQKTASLDELKKSLLQKAFSGELTKPEGMVA
jgi:type I restriction enzyme S subunit